MVQIRAKPPGGDLGLQIGVGRRDHANVRLHRARRSERLVLALLQHPQELDLVLRRHRRDLVEQDGPARRRGEAPRAILAGVGERAAHVAEQLALDERIGQRAHVDLDERSAAPPALLVERARHQLLAGARLADDEDARVRRRDGAHHAHDRAHRRRPPELVVHRRVRGAGRARAAQRQLRAARREQPVVVPRLAHVVARAELHRLDRALDGGPRRHQHDRQLGPRVAQLADEVDPLLPRGRVALEVHVEHDHVDRLRRAARQQRRRRSALTTRQPSSENRSVSACSTARLSSATRTVGLRHPASR